MESFSSKPIESGRPTGEPIDTSIFEENATMDCQGHGSWKRNLATKLIVVFRRLVRISINHGEVLNDTVDY